ncbi:hypothetical protein COT12_02060 [Candidatus Berkelbacteria bacterium CG08_land_8_20_14_0_20_39_8]|uniref:Cell envelope-related transcriptional attenuator domain-containing protein n=1 Tax=Candidatus Berkelbacteria bacterium CG08_land_8_20_14_0_20_39_8 TaxID=1974511 RepID=A0A2M6YC33_9BACT|nr:MAG: hypothetical protein COT12_02060 [Candidatus Berkelbacteria bacterium CG08_land_8_20_14_0_20_39_8]
MSKILLENPNQKRKPKSKKKLWIIIVIVVMLLAISGVAYAYWRGIFTKNYSNPSSLEGKINGDQNIALKGEGDGRINVLLLGSGGSNHPGGNLTDSLEVLSIDPINDSMAMLSIPRDLYVSIKSPSYSEKINEVYKLGDDKAKKGGGNLVKEEIGSILDLPMHYFIKIDFSGFEKAIDAVGGIDINVSKAIYDPTFPADDMVHYQTFKISVGEQHMNGSTALKYARSRETSSDFDRSARQQLVMQAFKNKVVNSSTLSNPEKVLSLVSALGSSVKTDMTPDEIKALIPLLKKIDSASVVSKVLDNSASGPLVSDSSSGTFYLKTKTGNWKEVQKITHEIFSDPYLKKEAANIKIINASGYSAAGNGWSSLLKSYGYNIIGVETAKTIKSTSEINDYSGGAKKYTLQFLSDRLDAKIVTKTEGSDGNIDLELIIGKDNKEAYAKISG